MQRENTIASSHQYGKQFKHIQELDKIDSSDSKTSGYSKGAVVNLNRFGSFIIELRPSLVSRGDLTNAKVFIFVKLFFIIMLQIKGETALTFTFLLNRFQNPSLFLFNRFQNPPSFLFNRFQNPPLFHNKTNQCLCDCISLSQFQVNHQKPQFPSAWKAVLFLTHRSPHPPCMILNMPHRMLDYISKDPKTRLDVLGG